MSTPQKLQFFTALVLAVSSCSVIGQSSSPWIGGAELSVPRAGSAATLLMDGRVLISGGEGSGGVLSSTEMLMDGLLFAPSGPMGEARRDHVAVRLDDGHVLVAGGSGASGAATATAELYDPFTDTWTATGALLEARSGATATRLKGGRVLVAGGTGAAGALASLEIYDPLAGTFTAVAASMSAARADHAAALLGDGRVLVAGGTDGSTVLASTEIYDPTAEALLPGPFMGRARAGLSATALLDGTVLLAGGTDGQADLDSAEICNLDASVCFPTPSHLATARRDHLALELPANSSVLIAGGLAGDTALASVELYRPWSGSFVDLAPLAQARVGAAATGLGVEGVALVAGGQGQTSSELLGFATIRTDCEDYPPGQPVIMTGVGWQPGEAVQLRLVEVPSTHPELVYTAVADSSGGLYHDAFAPDHDDIGVRFYVIASGDESEAAATFMDSPKVGAVTVAAQTGTPVYGTSSAASYTVTVLRGSGPGSSGNFNATLTLTTALPAGATASFSPAIVNLPPAANSATSTLTVTSGACTAPSSTAFTVQALTSAADFATGNGALTVAKRPLTVGIDPKTRSYGDTNPALTATPGGSGLATACGDTLADVGALSTTATSCSDVGAYPISFTASGPKASFYSLTTNAANLTVQARSLSVTADPKSRVYGDPNPALTAQFGGSGLATGCGDTLAAVGALSTAATQCSSVGAHPITFAATGPKAGNYAVSFTGANLSIGTRPITVTADAQSRSYGESNAGLTAQVGGSGLAAACGDSLADVGTLSSTATACSSIGTFAITFATDGPKGSNYAVSFTGADLTVEARPITVTADALSRAYGEANPALTAQIGGSGLAAACGDSLADLGTLTTAATQCSGVGTFAIAFTAGGPKAGNYDVAFTGADLTVEARPITVTADAQSRGYGDANPTLTAQVGGDGLAAACGDSLSDVGSLSTAATQCSAVGSFAIAFASNGPKAGNYDVAFTGADLAVEPRSITVTADAASRAYGDANPGLTAQVGGSGLAAACGDSLADVGSLSTAATACSNAGAFAIAFVIDGAKAANYDVDFAGADLTVEPRSITVTADAASRPYGDANSALTAQVGGSGLAAACGDSLADVGSLSTAATQCSGVGSFAIAFATDGPKGGNYDVAFTGADLTVEARPITVTADAQSRSYGDANPALTAAVGGSGLAAACGDSLADVGTLSTAATQCSDVGTFAIAFTAGGPKAGNYDVAFTGADLIVEARAIMVTADAQSRVYGELNPALTAQVGGSGLAAACGDALTDVGTLSTAATQCSDAGSFAIVFATDGPEAGNYDVAFVGADLTVETRPITVTADAQSRLYGDLNPALTAQVGGSGLAAACGDMLTDVGSLSTTATQCSDIGTFAIAFASDGPKAGNYDVAFAGADLTVEPRPITVTADAASRAYGDVNPALTAQVGGAGLAAACGDSLTDVGTLSTAAMQCSDVGTFAIDFASDGPKGGNYDVAFAGADLTVEARSITVTADAQSRSYGDANPALTAAVGGSGLAAACGDALTDVGTLSTAATQCSDVGAFAIDFATDGPKAGNYDVAFTGADLTVETRPITVTADALSRAYGDPNPALTAPVGGSGLAVACGDTLADVGTLSTTATQCSDAGAFAIAFTTDGAKAGNYDVAFTGADLTVEPRSVTVTADSASRAYGDANPGLTAQVGGSGLAAACGDSLADVGTLSTAATQCSDAGAFAIGFTTNGPKAGNYDVAFTSADLTVEPRSITVTADAASRAYGDANPALTAQVAGSGLAAACGDALADVGSLSTAATACSAVGSFAIAFTSNGPKGGNYDVAFTGADLTVLARSITVTPDAASRPYGDANPALTAQVGGNGLALGCGDELADVGTLSTAATSCSAVGSYVIGFLANGPSAANYAVTVGAASLSVNARPLTVTADALSRIYGDVNPALTAQLGGSGLAAGCGDVLADVGALSTVATPCSGVSSYAIVFSATGPKAGNYAVSFVGANLTVTKRALVVTATDRSIVLAAPLPAFTATYAGFACSDTAASLDTPVSFNPAATPGAVGSYPIVPFGASDANYVVSFVPGVLTVTYAPVGGPCSAGQGHKILQPINADGSSVFKKGSSVPAKFRVYDANCNSVGAPGVVTGFTLYQVTSGTAVTTVNEPVDSTSASSAFKFDATDGQWIFVISTKSSSYQAGKTYHYRVTLDDGSTIEFQFGLK